MPRGAPDRCSHSAGIIAALGLCHCLELGGCIEQVADWMNINRFQLNAAKTEFIWFVQPRRRHQLPSDHLAVGSIQVKPATSVRDLYRCLLG